MFILLLLFYLLNIYKTPLQIHFSPHCTLLWHCVALVILYKMKSDNIFTTKQFLLLLHNKHDYSRKNQLCRKCWQQSGQTWPLLDRLQTANAGYKNMNHWWLKTTSNGMTQPIRELSAGVKRDESEHDNVDWNQTNAFSISKKYAEINREQTLPCASNFSQMSDVIENYFSFQCGGHPWVQLECCHFADV